MKLEEIAAVSEDVAKTSGRLDKIGKLADLQLINLKQPHTTPAPDLVSTIVYAAEAADVVWVAIDGQVVLREGELVTLDEAEVIADANREALRLAGAVKQAV